MLNSYTFFKLKSDPFWNLDSRSTLIHNAVCGQNCNAG